MKSIFLLLTVLVVVVAADATATTIVVDLNGGGDYLAISHGIFYAGTGDTVLVAPGTYTGPLNRDLNFEGREILLMAMPGERDPVVIDAEYAGRCFIFESDEGRGAIVRDIIMRGGAADEGGGVQCSGACAPMFVNCEFRECVTSLGGGLNCEQGANPALVGCMFRENDANAAGGGIRCSEASVEITDCVFKANHSNLGGGVMLRAGSTAAVDNTDFIDNVAEYSGGFRNENSWATITNSRFSRNIATYSGGAIGSGGSGLVTLTYCVLVDNTADFRGAGFACGTPADVRHCTFVGGVSPNGSGIFCGPPLGDMVMEHSIVAFGSGPAMTCDEGGAPTATRCCVYGNTSDELCGSYTDIIYEDPMFCDLTLRDLSIHSDSPCMPENNPWGEQIGALGMGCSGGVPVESASWATIKAMYR